MTQQAFESIFIFASTMIIMLLGPFYVGTALAKARKAYRKEMER